MQSVYKADNKGRKVHGHGHSALCHCFIYCFKFKDFHHIERYDHNYDKGAFVNKWWFVNKQCLCFSWSNSIMNYILHEWWYCIKTQPYCYVFNYFCYFCNVIGLTFRSIIEDGEKVDSDGCGIEDGEEAQTWLQRVSLQHTHHTYKYQQTKNPNILFINISSGIDTIF